MGVAILASHSSAVRAEVAITIARDGHLVVPAYVNGGGPFPFILDTGADSGALYAWFADRLRLKKSSDENLSGQTGTARVPVYTLGKLSIDGASIRASKVYGLANRHDQGEEAGVAGNDLMDGSFVIFDFPCKSIALRPKTTPLDRLLPLHARWLVAGAIADGTALTLPVEINGVRGTGLLDTGSRDSRITPEFARLAGIDPASSRFRDGAVLYGANSKAASSRVGPIGQVRFAGFTVSGAKGRVMDLAALRTAGVGDRAMILGTDLMEHFRLVYDHAERRVWFGPSACKR